MSADWFYLRHGWFHKGKKIGPIDEHDFLLLIDQGKIQPDTLVQSEMKTRGHWIRMDKVGPALERWRRAHPTWSAPASATEHRSLEERT